jgi:hypothetical protein
MAMTRKSLSADKSTVKANGNSVKSKPEAEAPAEERRMEPIMARPDGYYWRTADGKQEFGPFESLAEAQADMDAADEEGPVPGESLQEAESEIGIADWIDPETGEPAEGLSPPHFDGD